MTLNELIRAYDEKNGRIPSEKNEPDHYSDFGKKLKRAFEALGVYNVDWLKSKNGKDYVFFEDDRDFIFELIDMESSSLFKKIRSDELNLEDYTDYVDILDKLVLFMHKHLTEPEAFNPVYEEFASVTRYPLLRRIRDTHNARESITDILNCFLTDNGMMPDWLYLTVDDKVALYDELLAVTKQWMQLAERVAEARADESFEFPDELLVEDTKLYSIVEDGISEAYIKAVSEKSTPNKPKPRNLKRQIALMQEEEASRIALKLQIAKEFCEKHELSYEEYLKQKAIVDAPNLTGELQSTEQLITQIKQDLHPY